MVNRKVNGGGRRRITLLLLLLNFGASALMPLILSKLLIDKSKEPGFTDAQSFGIAALTFIALTLIEIVILLDEMRRQRRFEHNLLTMRNEVEVDLVSLRDAHAGAVAIGGSGSLLPVYCGVLVRDLRRKVEAILASRKIDVDETFLFLSDPILDQFHGEKSDRIHIVHKLCNNTALLSPQELEWLKKVDAKVRGRKIGSVRRLLVYGTDAEIDAPISRELIAAHLGDRRYDCRLIRDDDFAELMNNYRIAAEVVDFGVYGDYCVFLGLQYFDSGLRGCYALDEGEVEHFKQAFEACWASALARRPDDSAYQAEGLPRTMGEFLLRVSGQRAESEVVIDQGDDVSLEADSMGQ